MVEKKLVEQQSAKKNISASESEINQAVANIKQNFAMEMAKIGKPLKGKELDKAFKAELKRQGLTEKKFRERIALDIASNKYVQKEIFSKVAPPKEKAIKKLFNDTMKLAKGDKSVLKNLKPKQAQSYVMLARNLKMEMQAKVKASHILIKMNPKADKKQQGQLYKKAMTVYNQAKKKEKDAEYFTQLAAKHSDDLKTKNNGGDMGVIVKGMLPPQLKALENKAFSLDAGQIGTPVKTPFGYHILRVTAKEAAKTLKFEQVKNELAKFMIMQERQKKLDNLLASLKKTNKVKITYNPKEDEQFKQYLQEREKNKKQNTKKSDKK
jgi:parvulin-like peptidyl-prolyl isomerase